MKISKERFDKAISRARGAGRAVVSGGKTSVYEGAVGVGSAYAGKIADSHIDALQDKPYLKGLGFLLAGHLLKKNKKTAFAGSALCGVGGYLLGEYLQNRKTEAAAPAVTPPATETRGFDTGAVYAFQATAPAPVEDTGFVVRSAAHAV